MDFSVNPVSGSHLMMRIVQALVTIAFLEQALNPIEGFAFLEGPVRSDELFGVRVAGHTLDDRLRGEVLNEIAHQFGILLLFQAMIAPPAIQGFQRGAPDDI